MSHHLTQLFSKLTQGVYAIGVQGTHQNNLFTASWLMQASFSPLMLALSINPHHKSYRLLKEGGSFTVNVLASDQLNLASHCASRTEDKLKGLNWRPASQGAPILNEALAWFECRLNDELRCGDHVIVTGSVMAGGIQNDAAKPLIYQDTGDMDGSEALYPDGFEKP